MFSALILNNFDAIREMNEVSAVHRAVMLLTQSTKSFPGYGNYMFTAEK